MVCDRKGVTAAARNYYQAKPGTGPVRPASRGLSEEVLGSKTSNLPAQVKRPEICIVRGRWAPLKVLTTPLLPGPRGVAGSVGTLKKSDCTRSLALSRMVKLLNSEVSTLHSFVRENRLVDPTQGLSTGLPLCRRSGSAVQTGAVVGDGQPDVAGAVVDVIGVGGRGAVTVVGRVRVQRCIRRPCSSRARPSHRSAFRLSIDAVDLVSRNISVPHQEARTAGAAAAILDRILVAVVLDRLPVGQLRWSEDEPVGPPAAHAGHLPAADHAVHEAVGRSRRGACPCRTAGPRSSSSESRAAARWCRDCTAAGSCAAYSPSERCRAGSSSPGRPRNRSTSHASPALLVFIIMYITWKPMPLE